MAHLYTSLFIILQQDSQMEEEEESDEESELESDTEKSQGT